MALEFPFAVAFKLTVSVLVRPTGEV